MPDALAGRVIDRVGDRRVGADIAELAEALHAGWVDVVVLLGKHDDLNVADVGVDRDEIVLQIAIDVRALRSSSSVASSSAALMPQIMPPISWLRAVRVFMMRPAAKAPTMRGTRISRVRALNPHFDEFRAEGEHQLLALRGRRPACSCPGRASARSPAARHRE